MSKLLGMLVALALFAVLPAVAFGQDTISSGNTQTGTINQSASAGAGGNAGNQAAIVQQNAGRDANASVNQSQNFSTGGAVVTSPTVTSAPAAVTSAPVTTRGVTTNRVGVQRVVPSVGVRSVGVPSAGVSTGGGVSTVSLAHTGFDAWIVALIGVAALTGGIGLLAAQRRGRASA
jgi:hypothetical protein